MLQRVSRIKVRHTLAFVSLRHFRQAHHSFVLMAWHIRVLWSPKITVDSPTLDSDSVSDSRVRRVLKFIKLYREWFFKFFWSVIFYFFFKRICTVYEQQAASKYAEESDDDILKRMIDRAELGGEWTSTSMSASWTAKTSMSDERHSALPPSGLRALYEVSHNRYPYVVEIICAQCRKLTVGIYLIVSHCTHNGSRCSKSVTFCPASGWLYMS